MRPSAEYIVYLIGIAIAGFSYEYVKTSLGSEPVFFVLLVAYLISLRIVGTFTRRTFERGQNHE
jgi:hypothetical protein